MSTTKDHTQDSDHSGRAAGAGFVVLPGSRGFDPDRSPGSTAAPVRTERIAITTVHVAVAAAPKHPGHGDQTRR